MTTISPDDWRRSILAARERRRTKEQRIKLPMITPKSLHLHLKGEYFDAIQRGEKSEEYRLKTPYFTELLGRAPFAGIVFYRGYPKADDTTKTMRIPWHGYEEKTITHPHFGDSPVRVYAIKLL